jgi:hypothetical protein
MHGTLDSRPPRRIHAAAKAIFLAALRRGLTREDAAAEAGFSLTGFYGARRHDPRFAADWTQALAGQPATTRRAKAYADRDARGAGELRIAPANRRWLQRRRRRHVRFTAERQQVCLAHLAATGDTKAAAAAAGVSESTVHLHRRRNRAFGECYREALAMAYARLEAEALHLGLMAQARLRHAQEMAAPGERPACCPTCGHRPGEAETFDRAMRLLARHDRKQRRAERGFRPGGRRQEWTFERSIEALDKALKGMGVPILGEGDGPQIPPRNGEGDRPEDGGGG